MRKSQKEKLKFFISNLMNEEQNKHSKLISDLRIAIGKTDEFDSASRVLTQVYDAKIEVLEKIYKELQVL